MFGSFVTSECGGLAWCVLLYWQYWWYRITNMVRPIIKRYSTPVPCKIPIKKVGSHHLAAPLPPAHQTIPVIIPDWECWVLERRRWGRLWHERRSSETWYYQLLTQNIPGLVTQHYPELTITQSISSPLLRLTDTQITPSSSSVTALKIPHQLWPKSPIWASDLRDAGGRLVEICRPTPSWDRTTGTRAWVNRQLEIFQLIINNEN